MRLAIFELSSLNHAVMIFNWVEICKVNGWEFQVFTTRDIYNQVSEELNLKDSEVYFLKSVTFNEFYKAKKVINLCDITIITSLQSYFYIYLLIFFIKTKVVLTVHNLNTWFFSTPVLSARSVAKYIIRRILRLKFSGYLVNSKNMLDYALSKKGISKPIDYLPFSLKTSKAQYSYKKSNVKRTIVYPGMVSEKRKNYDFFLKLAEDFPEIEFVLLGKMMLDEGAKDLLDKIRDRKLKNIIYYDDFVEQQEFDRVMCLSHAIFSFVNCEYYNDGVLEEYGKTKDSGISYLMAEYGLPLMVNSSFENLRHLNKATLYYNDYAEICYFLNKIANENEYYNSLRDSIFLSVEEGDFIYYGTKIKNFLERL